MQDFGELLIAVAVGVYILPCLGCDEGDLVRPKADCFSAFIVEGSHIDIQSPSRQRYIAEDGKCNPCLGAGQLIKWVKIQGPNDG